MGRVFAAGAGGRGAGGHVGGELELPDPSQLVYGYWACPGGQPRPGNWSRWCNARFTDLVSQANAIYDQDARAKLYVEAQDVFARETPAVLFASTSAFTAARKSVTGLKVHVLGGFPFFGRRLGAVRVAVVGAGVFGASAAYHLAEAGAEVVVVDRADDGRATAAGAGIVDLGWRGSTIRPRTASPMGGANLLSGADRRAGGARGGGNRLQARGRAGGAGRPCRADRDGEGEPRAARARPGRGR